MIKKLLLAVATVVATMGMAFAQVDVNKADEAALNGIKGLGPAKTKLILEERTKGGDFKDWADFEKRIVGIGEKSALKLSSAGLLVNGQGKAGAEAAKPVAAKAAAKADQKVAEAKPKKDEAKK